MRWGLFVVCSLTKNLKKVSDGDMMFQVGLNLASVGPGVEYCHILDDQAADHPGDTGIISYLK